MSYTNILWVFIIVLYVKIVGIYWDLCERSEQKFFHFFSTSFDQSGNFFCQALGNPVFIWLFISPWWLWYLWFLGKTFLRETQGFNLGKFCRNPVKQEKKIAEENGVIVALRVVHLSCVWKSGIKPLALRGAPVFYNFLYFLTFPNPLFFWFAKYD